MRSAALILCAAGLLYSFPSEAQAQQRSGTRNRVERGAELRKHARERRHKADQRQFKSERKSVSARDRVRVGRDGRYRELDRRIPDGRRARYDPYRYDPYRYGSGRTYRYPYRRGTRYGPAFCRFGVGHPVYGLRWCYDKAFWVYGRPYWRYYGPYPVVYRRPYYVGPHRRAYRPGYRLRYASLLDLLGHTAVDLLLYDVLKLGPHYVNRVYGYWYDPSHHEQGHHGTGYYDLGYRGDDYDGALALQLYLDEEPLAELTDFDRDGRVDVVLVNSRR